MDPILLDLGFIQIYWYSVCIFLGILIGGWITLAEAKKFGIEENFIINLFFWAIIFAFVGARAYFVILNWSQYSNDILSIFKVWEGGLAIHGAMIAGLLFVIIYSAKYKMKTTYILDFAVVGLIIGQAIGRWGNFFNQEAHGIAVSEATLKSLFVPNFIIEGMNIGGTYYLPTFLFESILCLIGFIVLLIIRRTKYVKIGQITSLYLIWYGAIRFFIEIFRTDSLMILGLKAAQIMSGFMLFSGILMFIVCGPGNKLGDLYKEGNKLQS